MNPILRDLLWSLAVLGFLGGCFLGVRALGVRTGLSPELSRKLVHISMAVAVLPFPWIFAHRATVVILGLLATGGLFGMRLFASKGDGELGGVLYRVGRIRSVGELVYPPAVVVTYLIAPSPVGYVIPILVLGFADGMAALVGTEYAKKSISAERESPKSFEGAVAFFCAAFICVASPLLLFSNLPGPTILLVTVLTAAISALLELVCSFGLDNFLIPFLISVFLRRLTSLTAAQLTVSLGLLLVFLAVAGYCIRKLNITKLGAVEALLVLFLTTLLGDFYWVAAPFILSLTYAVLPSLTVAERERPLNYHDVEANLIPGAMIIVVGAILGMPAPVFWIYSVYYACLTAKNYTLRLYNYYPERRYTSVIGVLRAVLLQLVPSAGIWYAAYGSIPGFFYVALAILAVILELALSAAIVRRYDFPTISLRLGWICSLSSVLFAALAALIPRLF